MADADLQQYNGTPNWQNDLVAASKLLPRDGKKITADDNGTGKAPVNRSLKQISDLLIAVHDGIFGTRSGAVIRTLKSLAVDGTGGTVSSLADGMIQATNDIASTLGSIIALTGDISADLGDLIAGAATSLVKVGLSPAQRTELSNHALRFLATGTGSTDANPPTNTALSNEQRAINIEKVACYCDMSAGNVFVSHDGFNLSALAIVALTSFPGQAGIRLTFASAFADTNYQAVATAVADGTHPAEHVIEDKAMRTTTSCTFFFKSSAVVAGALQFVDPTATPVNFSVKISGKQTT